MLDIGELQAAMADYPEIIEMLQSVMDAVDLSQEHTINYQEFLAATMARNTFIKENYIKLAFQKFDSDKSGYPLGFLLRRLFHPKISSSRQ